MVDSVAKKAVTRSFIHDSIFCRSFAYGSWNTMMAYQEKGNNHSEKWPGLGLMFKKGGQQAKLQHKRHCPVSGYLAANDTLIIRLVVLSWVQRGLKQF